MFSEWVRKWTGGGTGRASRPWVAFSMITIAAMLSGCSPRASTVVPGRMATRETSSTQATVIGLIPTGTFKIQTRHYGTLHIGSPRYATRIKTQTASYVSFQGVRFAVLVNSAELISFDSINTAGAQRKSKYVGGPQPYPCQDPSGCGSGIGGTGCDPSLQDCGPCPDCEGPITDTNGQIWCNGSSCGSDGTTSYGVGVFRVGLPNGSLVCNYEFDNGNTDCSAMSFIPVDPGPPRDLTLGYFLSADVAHHVLRCASPGSPAFVFVAGYTPDTQVINVGFFPSVTNSMDYTMETAPYLNGTGMNANYHSYGFPLVRNGVCHGMD